MVPGSIELIGCHGQTIFHERESTLQIGDGCVLAELTGIPVVSDFRPRDIAAGGHGAPLVPFLDYMLFRDRKLGRVALNLGGIGNITAIPPGAKAEDVIAFDTGPGNMVIDQLAAISTNGRQTYDKGGAIAARGKGLGIDGYALFFGVHHADEIIRARQAACVGGQKTVAATLHGLNSLNEL